MCVCVELFLICADRGVYSRPGGGQQTGRCLRLGEAWGVIEVKGFGLRILVARLTRQGAPNSRTGAAFAHRCGSSTHSMACGPCTLKRESQPLEPRRRVSAPSPAWRAGASLPPSAPRARPPTGLEALWKRSLAPTPVSRVTPASRRGRPSHLAHTQRANTRKSRHARLCSSDS